MPTDSHLVTSKREGAKYIADMLSQNGALMSCDVQDNGLDDEAKALLRKGFEAVEGRKGVNLKL